MKTCLIVDDSRVVRKVACRLFAEYGFECREAEDGQKAFNACAEGMPDLILLDWNMPVMSGIEFLEKVRKMDGGDKPKIVFCTTQTDPASMQRAIRAGANEYIMKPFDSDIVRVKLKQMGVI